MEKLIATNKKAYYDYFIEESLEAGIELKGSEVKSIRLGRVNMKDSFALIKNDELFLLNVHISPYEKGSFFNEEPRRTRKLLVKRQEINKLRGKIEQKGNTIVPTKMYFKDSLVKVEIAVCKGKELHDKRQTIKEKENKRAAERAIKEYKN